MDITVTFQNGRWVTDPSPAIVAVGTSVRWILRAPEQRSRSLRWMVKFGSSLPFGQNYSTLEVTTQLVERRERDGRNLEVLQQLGLADDADMDHRGVTQPHTAEKPGDFKYDLVVEDASTGERIGDDDPWLIVVRGVIRPFDLFAY